MKTRTIRILASALALLCHAQFGYSEEKGVDNSIGMRLVAVPIQRQSGEQKTLMFGATEVTRAQYKSIMGSDPSTFAAASGADASAEKKFPVDNVSMNDAAEFCRKLSAVAEEKSAGRVYRLPTEAEWEQAAGAGAKSAWFFGDRPFRCDLVLEPVGEQLRTALKLDQNQGAIVMSIAPESLAASKLKKDDVIVSLAGKPIRDVNSGIAIIRQNRNKKVKVEFIRQPEGRMSFEITVPEGNDIDHFAWYSTNSMNMPHQVKQKLPNAYGLYDMYGNVAEWCSDYFDTPSIPGATLQVTKIGGDFANDPQLRILQKHLDAPDGFLVTGLTAEAKARGFFHENDVILVPSNDIYGIRELIAYCDNKLADSKTGSLSVDLFRNGKKTTIEIPKEQFRSPNSARTAKGGAYHSLVFDTQTKSRVGCEPDGRASSIGFRVVCEMTEKAR